RPASDRPPAPPRVRTPSPPVPALAGGGAVLEHLPRPRRDRPGRRRPDGRRVPADLPHGRSPLRVPRLRPEHLPRVAIRAQRLLSPAGGAPTSGTVHLG